MISPVRTITALCALGAALTACGAPQASTRIANATASPSAVSSSRPPTLAPGPAGLTPVFEHGLRTRTDKTVALTFDAGCVRNQV